MFNKILIVIRIANIIKKIVILLFISLNFLFVYFFFVNYLSNYQSDRLKQKKMNKLKEIKTLKTFLFCC